MKYIPATHPDYDELVETKSKIDALTSDINEGKRRYEQEARLKELQESINGLPLVCHRQSIR